MLFHCKFPSAIIDNHYWKMLHTKPHGGHLGPSTNSNSVAHQRGKQMKFVGVFLLSVAGAVMARAFDMDTLLKECSVERTGPGKNGVQAHPSVPVSYNESMAAPSVRVAHTCAECDGSYECIGRINM